MQTLISEAIAPSSPHQNFPFRVLGTPLVLDLEAFPELSWIPIYLNQVATLQHERDLRLHEIKTVSAEGDIYRNCWIEPYTKSKNGKQYRYYQLRSLTGERKKSGQPKVKTKHLSCRAVAEVRAAIARGHQVEELERQIQEIEMHLSRLKRLVQGIERRLQRLDQARG